MLTSIFIKVLYYNGSTSSAIINILRDYLVGITGNRTNKKRNPDSFTNKGIGDLLFLYMEGDWQAVHNIHIYDVTKFL